MAADQRSVGSTDAVESPTFPRSDTIGSTGVTTWLDESKGLRSYRTEVSPVDALARGGIWSAVAESPEQASRNHEAGVIQAAEVELDAWLRSAPTDVSAEILAAGKRLGLDARAVAALRAAGASADEHRKRAAQRLAALGIG